ncbi:hypothetical protein [Desulfosarcina ovata]|uniref:Secretin/TonB short N-terminal domain-containing protein n=1 Tax=Desulfosarcina ovata subsp. ovata TaxID=2752305 RepID=A0A5K8AJK5_9BACT|nr:hypothetical protein [Desulfosarcina ovata]BBO91854.1 hypothetical protein DSCOOX_50340 [Desulfosarcina ovata subsp. ovata]
MKTIRFLICWLSVCWIAGGISAQPLMAQDAAVDPLISLTVKDQPLGEVLDTLAAETGYQFKLNSQWEDWPVSATIGNLPLEKGLKRLLRSLNHTIIWESDNVVTIMVYGKTDPGGTGPAVSFASPPQAEPQEPVPAPDDEQVEDEETDETPEEAAEGDVADPDESADEKRPMRVGRPGNPPRASGTPQTPGAVEPPAVEVDQE